MKGESRLQRDLYRGATCGRDRRAFCQKWLRKERRIRPVESCVHQAPDERRGLVFVCSAEMKRLIRQGNAERCPANDRTGGT